MRCLSKFFAIGIWDKICSLRGKTKQTQANSAMAEIILTFNL